MKVTPFILGTGRAGNALQKSLALISIQYPEFKIAECQLLERGQNLKGLTDGVENPILFIANPPGLHAKNILEAHQSGFKAIVVEKPACVSLDEVSALESVPIPVAVCHIYRQMWGIQTMKQMIASGELGEVIAIEGRYWQSSAAQRALSANKTSSWKNEISLSGKSDVLLDIGTHWIDAAIFLMGEFPSSGNIWKSFANAEAAHRDTHVQVTMEFSQNRRAMGSISKTFHGAGNHFEMNVVGSKKSATWNFLSPDQIFFGIGGEKSTLARTTNEMGSQQPAFHALGWLEGYIEIIVQLFRDLEGKKSSYPALKENLKVLKSIFSWQSQ